MRSVIFHFILAPAIATWTLASANAAAMDPVAKSRAAVAAQIPSLDELGGNWWNRADLGQFPSIHNFDGQLLVNKDLASISWLASPPYSQGFHSGVLRINGNMPVADKFRWFPYQAIRAGSMDGLAIETVNRMVFDSRGVLWRITLSNTGSLLQSGTASIDLIGAISKLDMPRAWLWAAYQPGAGGPGYRYGETEAVRAALDSKNPPKLGNAADYTAAIGASGTSLLISDTKTAARTAFAFARKPDALTTDGHEGVASWNYRLAPGATVVIEFVMAFGDGDPVAADATHWAGRFDSTFADARDLWEKRYEDVFIPNNGYFEGNLPVLLTGDPALRRNYYMGVVTLLLMLDDQLPGSPRVFGSGSPRFSCSVQFIWDTGLVDTLLALLEPKVMHDYIVKTLQWNLDHGLAYDYYANRVLGHLYVANYPHLFRIVSSYLRVTGNRAFLDEKIGKMTLLEQMNRLAENYRRYLMPDGSGVADFGGNPNFFLECVPTYIHATAGFNATYVDMLRQMAELYDSLDSHELAEADRAEADKLALATLKLYVPGEGVWRCRYPGGHLVASRHCIDFIYVGTCMAQDLSPTIRQGMRDFVEHELITKNWMRAMSLQDPAAAHSDRYDHGPEGAYSGWPPETVDGLCHLGYWQDALDFYRRCEAATHEGAFSQGHEFYGPYRHDYGAPIRIAGQNNCRESLCGADFTDVVIRTFFGYHPDFSGRHVLWDAAQPRGFIGELRNVRCRGKLYTIRSGTEGLHLEMEN